MKYETFQKRGGWGWRVLKDGEVHFQSPKTFPREDAARRNMLRAMQGKLKQEGSRDPATRKYLLPDGRQLTTRVYEEDGKWRWSILTAAIQANGGFQWQEGVVGAEPTVVSEGSFDSEADARRDLVLTIKHGGCDDHIARKHRDKRERHGRPGERMEVKVEPLSVAASSGKAEA